MSMLRIIEERFMITTHKRFIHTYTEIRVDTQTSIWYIHISICTRAISIVLWRRFSWNVSSDTILSTRSLYVEELRHRDGVRERERANICMYAIHCSDTELFRWTDVSHFDGQSSIICSKCQLHIRREKKKPRFIFSYSKRFSVRLIEFDFGLSILMANPIKLQCVSDCLLMVQRFVMRPMWTDEIHRRI